MHRMKDGWNVVREQGESRTWERAGHGSGICGSTAGGLSISRMAGRVNKPKATLPRSVWKRSMAFGASSGGTFSNKERNTNCNKRENGASVSFS